MKNRFQKKDAIIALCLTVTACTVTTKDARDTIIFSHHLHTEQGLECADCHGPIRDASTQSIAAIPQKEQCGDCHDVGKSSNCATCHQNANAPQSYRPLEQVGITFSHPPHLANGLSCDDCHRGAAHWPATRDRRPPGPGHVDCASCHQKDLDAGRCGVCHQRLELHRKMPEKIFSHEADFFKRHGSKAMGNEALCAQCHDQSYCTDCHAGTMNLRPSVRYPERVDRTFVHRGDWQSRHALEARIGDTGCLKCHGTSFCSSCHERHGVGGAVGGKAGLNPHANEIDWISSGGASGHGRAARRRITECAACHDQGPASVCVRCHREAHNPHPPGWDPPVPRSERTSHKMCSICHTL